MIKPKGVAAVAGIALIIAIGAMAAPTANASHVAPVGLGAADSYAVFAAATITSSGPTTINGDLGLHPGTSVTETPIMTVNGARNVTNPAALSARNLLKGAYIDTAARTPATTVAGDVLGGMTFVSGVYSGGALDLSTTAPNNVVTLDGENDPSAVFIFQAASTLTTGAGTTVNLTRGAQSCNVFWQVGSSATLGAGSIFRGTILAHTSISVGTSALIDGRLVAGVGASPASDSGALTLLSNTVTRPTCVVAPSAPIPPTRPPFTIAPTATVTVAPTATPIGSPASTATPMAAATPVVAPTATPGSAATPVVATAQMLPSTSTNDPSTPLLMLGIALVATGTLVLRRPIRI